MSEQLNNSQNNTDNTAPTGWENMANYTPEETQAPVQEAPVSESPETAASVKERAELVKRIKWLEQLRRQNPEIAAEMRQKARDALLEIVNESVPEYSDKLVADDLDGDGVREDNNYNATTDSSAPAELSVSEEHIEPLPTPSPEAEPMSNDEFNEWADSVLIGILANNNENAVKQPSQTPNWLNRWEEKKKNF